MVSFVPHRPGSGAPGEAELPLLCLRLPSDRNLQPMWDDGSLPTFHSSFWFKNLKIQLELALLVLSQTGPVWRFLIKQQMKPGITPDSEEEQDTVRGLGFWCPPTVPGASSAPPRGSGVEMSKGRGRSESSDFLPGDSAGDSDTEPLLHQGSCWSWLSVSSCELTPTKRRTTKALSRAAKCKEVTQPESFPIISLYQQSWLLLFRQLSLLCFALLTSWNWRTQICELRPSRTHCELSSAEGRMLWIYQVSCF